MRTRSLLVITGVVLVATLGLVALWLTGLGMEACETRDRCDTCEFSKYGPQVFDMQHAPNLTVEEVADRYPRVLLPTWMPDGIKLTQIYDGGSFVMLTYSDRGETHYWKDNVTIELCYTRHKSTRESLFDGHPGLKVTFANNITALVFFRDRQHWHRPLGEGFPVQEGACAVFTKDYIEYRVSGLSGHVSIEDMKRIVENMAPVGPATIRKTPLPGS